MVTSPYSRPTAVGRIVGKTNAIPECRAHCGTFRAPLLGGAQLQISLRTLRPFTLSVLQDAAEYGAGFLRPLSRGL